MGPLFVSTACRMAQRTAFEYWGPGTKQSDPRGSVVR